LPAAHVLPPPPTANRRRQRALDDLKQRLGIRPGTVRSFTILQGWPEVGKSTTVAALAHDREVASHFPNGILWASLGEALSLRSERKHSLLPSSAAKSSILAVLSSTSYRHLREWDIRL
jgi:hypothetical protein